MSCSMALRRMIGDVLDRPETLHGNRGRHFAEIGFIYSLGPLRIICSTLGNGFLDNSRITRLLPVQRSMRCLSVRPT